MHIVLHRSGAPSKGSSGARFLLMYGIIGWRLLRIFDAAYEAFAALDLPIYGE